MHLFTACTERSCFGRGAGKGRGTVSPEPDPDCSEAEEVHRRSFFDLRPNPTVRSKLVPILLALLVFGGMSGPAALLFQWVPPSSSPVPASTADVTSATIVASPSSVYVGEEVTFFANATSSSASSIKFTIYYDAIIPPPPTPNPASPVTVNITGNPGNVVQKYTYDHVGNLTGPGGQYFFVRLRVDDGVQNVSRSVLVYVNENRAPSFAPRPPSQMEVDKGALVNFSILVSDPDNDTLDATWDFGDGTVVTNHTSGAKLGIWVNQSHAWDPYVEPGTGNLTFYYWMNFTVEDPFGHVNKSTTLIIIKIPPNLGPSLGLQAYPLEVNPGDPVTFVANATDFEGEMLTWTFAYGDGAVEVFTTDPTPPGTLVWLNRTHQYWEVGAFNATVSVSDALGENQVGAHNFSRRVAVSVVANSPPSVSETISYSGTLMIDTAIGYTDVRFSVWALDNDGDIVTATWYLNDEEFATNATPGGSTQDSELVQVIRFTDPGTYFIRVVVTDGREGHEDSVSSVLSITSNNLPPNLVIGIDFSYGPNRTFALLGEVLTYLVVISDPELDPVELVWDFGDDSPRLYFNLTEYDENGTVRSSVTHSYSAPGEYTITVWFTDNKIGLLNHSKVITAVVTVSEETIIIPHSWDWWDYTSLGLLCMIPVLVVVWFGNQRRKIRKLEAEGLTIEEDRIQKERMLTERMLESERRE